MIIWVQKLIRPNRNRNEQQKSDICVLPQNKKHSFGHIAIYNEVQWVSDYKQETLYPSRAYRKNGGCQFSMLQMVSIGSTFGQLLLIGFNG